MDLHTEHVADTLAWSVEDRVSRGAMRWLCTADRANTQGGWT
jgi:hypothetical protein